MLAPRHLFALAVATSLSACSGGSDSKVIDFSSSTTSVSHTESHSETTDLNPVNPQPAQTGCPWNLQETGTYKIYKAIGVEITVDCKAVTSERSWDYKYTDEDFAKTMAALDASYATVEAQVGKIREIALGRHAFHRGSDRFVQIALGATENNQKQLPNYLGATIQVMDIEKTLFQNRVRVNFETVEMIRDKDGKRIDVGTTFMSAPSQEYLNKDFLALGKFREQILANADRFSNIVLFHGNEMARFELQPRTESYFFSSDAFDAQNKDFFRYLTSYEKAAQGYAPVSLYMNIYADFTDGFKHDFRRTQDLLGMVERIRDVILSKPEITMLVVYGRGSSSRFGDDDIYINFNQGRLTISNSYDSFGNPLPLQAIRDCIAKQDYTKLPFNAHCSARR